LSSVTITITAGLRSMSVASTHKRSKVTEFVSSKDLWKGSLKDELGSFIM
jgi:hypothetical protein